MLNLQSNSRKFIVLSDEDWYTIIINRGCKFVKSKQRRNAGTMKSIKLY